MEDFLHRFNLLSLHSVQNRTDNSSHNPAFYLSPTFVRQVLVNGMGELCDRQCLQPDPSRAGEGGEKNSIATEDHVLDAGNGRDVERDAGLKCSDVAGMHTQSFSRLQVANNEFAGKFELGGALSAEVLEQKAAAAENARAKRLLEAD